MGGGRKPVVYVTAGGQTFAPGEDIPADIAKTIDNPKVWGDGGDAVEGNTKGYADQKVDELKAEIESRNVDREDDAKLSTDGKKADLVAALEADDEAQAES